MRWVYEGGAEVIACAAYGVSLWRVTGDVTTEALPRIMVHAFAWHEEVRAHAHVADFSAAQMLASADGFIRLGLAIVRPPMFIAGPMAITLRGDQHDYFAHYAAAMRQRGVERVLMPDQTEALRWAQAHAETRAVIASASGLRAGTPAPHPAAAPGAGDQSLPPVPRRTGSIR